MATDPPRLYVALYTDTDVHGKLVKQIRAGGYDAISAGEVNNQIPFEAKVLGETVQVIGIDDNRCDLKRGVITTVRKGNKEYGAALSEIKLPKKLQHNKWVEMYQYWLRG